MGFLGDVSATLLVYAYNMDESKRSKLTLVISLTLWFEDSQSPSSRPATRR